MYEIYIFYTAITTRGFRKHDWLIWLTSPSPVIYVHIDATLLGQRVTHCESFRRPLMESPRQSNLPRKPYTLYHRSNILD